jgi:hypothetical protein
VDELVEMESSSKAGQEGMGAMNNVYADDTGSPACTVMLYNKLRAMNPGYFDEANDEGFLCTLANGELLKGHVVEKMLKDAAVRLRFSPAGFTLHSLRSGGATAMWHAGYEAFAIQSRGRWRSDAFKTYIWDGRERARDVATRMWASRPSLLAALRQREAAVEG